MSYPGAYGFYPGLGPYPPGSFGNANGYAAGYPGRYVVPTPLPGYNVPRYPNPYPYQYPGVTQPSFVPSPCPYPCGVPNGFYPANYNQFGGDCAGGRCRR